MNLYMGIALTVCAVLFIALIIASTKIKKTTQEAKEAQNLADSLHKKYSEILDVEEYVNSTIEKADNYRQSADEYVTVVHDQADSYSKMIHKEADEYYDETRNKADSYKISMERDSKQIVWKLTEKKEKLEKTINSKKEELESLHKELAELNEEKELIDIGLYPAKFDYEDSESFKAEIIKCRDRQKKLASNKTRSGAIWCSQEWTVGNSRTEGKRMTNQAFRLALRAFNGECDAAIAKVTWKNYETMYKRVNKSFETVNKSNESNCIYLTKSYLNEKLHELRLTYQNKLVLQREKEEQAEIRAQMREEEKALRDAMKAEKEAEKEAKRYEKALNEARAIVESMTGEKLEKQKAKIEELEKYLEEALLNKERAISMAQQTRRGHVYVISNIGSFGEGIYKIGMTRRLDPMDRVKELGDASVPFTFDVHAMIHSKDAPALEKALHKKFERQRVNLVNYRKEFFKVTLNEIKEAISCEFDGEVKYIETAVAQHYYESQAIRSGKVA